MGQTFFNCGLGLLGAAVLLMLIFAIRRLRYDASKMVRSDDDELDVVIPGQNETVTLAHPPKAVKVLAQGIDYEDGDFDDDDDADDADEPEEMSSKKKHSGKKSRKRGKKTETDAASEEAADDTAHNDEPETAVISAAAAGAVENEEPEETPEETAEETAAEADVSGGEQAADTPAADKGEEDIDPDDLVVSVQQQPEEEALLLNGEHIDGSDDPDSKEGVESE